MGKEVAQPRLLLSAALSSLLSRLSICRWSTSWLGTHHTTSSTMGGRFHQAITEPAYLTNLHQTFGVNLSGLGIRETATSQSAALEYDVAAREKELTILHLTSRTGKGSLTWGMCVHAPSPLNVHP